MRTAHCPDAGTTSYNNTHIDAKHSTMNEKNVSYSYRVLLYLVSKSNHTFPPEHARRIITSLSLSPYDEKSSTQTKSADRMPIIHMHARNAYAAGEYAAPHPTPPPYVSAPKWRHIERASPEKQPPRQQGQFEVNVSKFKSENGHRPSP